jgi:hypothetical protein
MLNQQLDRLSVLEREIAYWLVIWQEPISLSRLQTHLLGPPDLAAILESITSLAGRSLLEKVFHTDEPLFTLPSLVMKAVSDELIERAEQEICQATQAHDVQQFQIMRSHCLLRPGTDDIAGDRILTQLRDRLWRSVGSNLPQCLHRLLSHLQRAVSFLGWLRRL